MRSTATSWTPITRWPTWQAAERRGGFRGIVRYERRLSAERDRGHHQDGHRQVELQSGIHTQRRQRVGVANALAALEAGATHVQGTVNGYGDARQLQPRQRDPLVHFKMKRAACPRSRCPSSRNFPCS